MTKDEKREALVWIKKHDPLGCVLIRSAPFGILLMLFFGVILSLVLGWMLCE